MNYSHTTRLKGFEPPKNQSFDDVNNKRIQAMERQLSQQCSEYDSLMHLLELSPLLNSIPTFQKEINSFNRQLTFLNQNIEENDSKSAAFDRNFWQKELDSIQKLLEDNQRAIKESQKNSIKQNRLTPRFNYKQTFEKFGLGFEEYCHHELACFKNELQSQLNSRPSDHVLEEQAIIEDRVEEHFEYVEKGLEALEEKVDAQMTLLDIDSDSEKTERNRKPYESLQKFHQHNFNRIHFELVQISGEISSYLKKFTSDGHLQTKKVDELPVIREEIDALQSQIRGSAMLYLNELSELLYREVDKFPIHKFETTIEKDMRGLAELLQQVNIKFDKLSSVFNSEP